jgi:hypothetical protein
MVQSPMNEILYKNCGKQKFFYGSLSSDLALVGVLNNSICCT